MFYSVNVIDIPTHDTAALPIITCLTVKIEMRQDMHEVQSREGAAAMMARLTDISLVFKVQKILS